MITVEFPEHDSKIDLGVYYGFSADNLSHGCMTSGLNNLTVRAESNTTKSIATGLKKPDGNISALLDKLILTEGQLNQLFSPILQAYVQPIVLIADRINVKSQMSPDYTRFMACRIKTTDFVEWLIRNKHGIVVTGPVCRHPAAYSPASFSIVQGFIWTPPSAVQCAIPHSEQTFYPDNVLSKEKWAFEAGDMIRKHYSQVWYDNFKGFSEKAFRKDSPLFKRVFELNHESDQRVMQADDL